MLVDLRAHAIGHPLLLLVLAAIVCAVFHAARRRLFTGNGDRSRPWLAAATCAAALAYLGAAIGYALVPAYLDHVEPSVAAVSWLAIQGTQPVYPEAGSALMYGLPYGPALFLANGLLLAAIGPGIMASKAAGVAAALASVGLLAVAVHRATPSRDAASTSGRLRDWMMAVRWASLACLAFGAASFWVRAEPLLLLCSTVAVLSITAPAGFAAVLLGAALGCGVNLKVSAILYMLPATVLLWRRHGARTLAIAAGVALMAVTLPFVVFSTIAVDGYVAWVRAATTQGMRASAVPAALEWASLLIAAMFVPTLPPDRAAISSARWLTVVSIVLSLPLALKHGTGIYHFLPFVPPVVFVACLGVRRPSFPAPGALAMSLAILGVLQAAQWVPALISLPAREIARELNEIAASHTGTTAMGYSLNYRLSFFRPLLVFEGEPYALDGASLMDWHWSRRPFPTPALDALRNCAVETWAIPAGAPPFELPNAYPIEGDVFPDDFRRIFTEKYALEKRGQWFDVWRCRQSLIPNP